MCAIRDKDRIMSKRLIKLVLGVSLCMSSSLFVFASDASIDLPSDLLNVNSKNAIINKLDSLTKQDKKQQIDNFKLAIDQKNQIELKKKFEVASPKLVIDSNIKLEPEVLVSIRFLERLDANISIMRFIEPRSIVFSDENKREISEVLKNAPLYVGEEVGVDKSSIYDVVVESTIDDDVLEYKDIYELYDKMGKELLQANEKYQLVYMETLKQYNLEARELNALIRNRILKLRGYADLYRARIGYELAARNYLKCRDIYESYHREVVLEEENMIIQGALPYYNYVLKNPQYGRYEVIIKDNESGQVIDEVFEFNIKAKEKIQQDLLENLDKNLRKGLPGY